MPAVNISALLAGDVRRLRCNRWPLPPNEQLALQATLSAYLLLLSLFIHAPVHVVSHVSPIIHTVVCKTPFLTEMAVSPDVKYLFIRCLVIKCMCLCTEHSDEPDYVTNSHTFYSKGE